MEGWLSPREIRFLASAAFNPKTEGEILELGAYHGKSTIVLALASLAADKAPVTSIDPMDAPELAVNLQLAGVSEHVNAIPAYSTDAIDQWNRPLRLFWLDGANDVTTVRQDIQGYLPHLADRGIIAFHDILNLSGDRLHNFVEDVLKSEHFGAAGMCGSIGWAQYRVDANEAKKFQASKNRLIKQLSRLKPFYCSPRKEGTWHACQYKLLRSLVSHRKFNEQEWRSLVA